jgi:hypothetical protein
LWFFARLTAFRRAGAALEETDDFNQAAEACYARHASSAQLLDKPFSEPDALRRLGDAGVLIDGLSSGPATPCSTAPAPAGCRIS